MFANHIEATHFPHEAKLVKSSQKSLFLALTEDRTRDTRCEPSIMEFVIVVDT